MPIIHSDPVRSEPGTNAPGRSRIRRLLEWVATAALVAALLAGLVAVGRPWWLRREMGGELDEWGRGGDLSHLCDRVREGVPVDTCGRHGVTLLMAATMAGDVATVEFALARGANVEHASPEGGTVLSCAIGEDQPEVLARLLARHPDLTQDTGLGLTPLAFAAAMGDRRIVRMLLQAGAAPEAVGTRGKTALHAAADHWSTGAEGTIDLLLRAGAPVNARDRDGRTPLHTACLHESIGVVRRLVRAGADVNARDGMGMTPSEVARGGLSLHISGPGPNEIEAMEEIQRILRKAGARR